jgi:ketosteroid isomerase-like protein
MHRSLLVLIALTLFGCPSPAPDVPAEAPATAGPSETPPPRSIQAPPKLDRVQVRALLDSWLEAQNQGDYEAYSALYAQKFYGVKRSGPRTYRFAREGWLQDRQRMFRKQVTVEAEDVRVTSSSQTAEVRFIQSWASGSYKDVGPKQLVVVREGDGLRLAREEMLASKIVQEGGGAAGPGDPGQFLFVQDLGGALWVLLEQEADEAWGVGQPQLVSRGPSIARKTADPGQLGTESTSMKGRVVVLYGDSGPICKATIGELAVVSRFWPHFGMEQEWAGEYTGQAFGDHDIAEEIWGMGPKELWGRLGVVGRGDCMGARWARDATLPEARVYAPSAQVASSMQPTVQKAFRQLRGYAEIQKEFLEFVEEHDNRWWDQYDGEGPLEVVAFVDQAGGRTVVAARATAGMGCGMFWGQFWAVWEVRSTSSGPQLALLTDDRVPGDVVFLPTSVFDLEGDGKPELIDSTTLVQPIDASHQVTIDAEVPSYDCPC